MSPLIRIILILLIGVIAITLVIAFPSVSALIIVGQAILTLLIVLSGEGFQ